MKNKMFTLLAAIFLSGNLSAQDKKIKEDLVPESVIKEFRTKYKKLEIKAWYEDDSGYSAQFQKGETKPRAYFKNDGTWIRTTIKIKEEGVSSAVKKSIKNTEWKDWKITESYKVETPEFKKLFELHMKKGSDKKVLLFDPTGKAMDIK